MRRGLFKQYPSQASLQCASSDLITAETNTRMYETRAGSRRARRCQRVADIYEWWCLGWVPRSQLSMLRSLSPRLSFRTTSANGVEHVVPGFGESHEVMGGDVMPSPRTPQLHRCRPRYGTNVLCPRKPPREGLEIPELAQLKKIGRNCSRTSPKSDFEYGHCVPGVGQT